MNEVDDVLRGRARQENFRDTGFFQFGYVGFGNDAAEQHDNVGHAFVVQQLHELRADGVVRAG